VTLIRFTIPGPAIGKGRPRFSRKSGAAFTPAKTRNHEAFVKMLAVQAMADRPPATTPVRVHMQIMCTVPPSWPKAKREAAKANMLRPGRPDIDNAVKANLDAMNGVVFADDALVYYLEVTKLFADQALTTVEVHV